MFQRGRRGRREQKKKIFESLCFEFTHLHEVVQPFVGDHRERAVPAVAILFLCGVLSLETGCCHFLPAVVLLKEKGGREEG